MTSWSWESGREKIMDDWKGKPMCCMNRVWKTVLYYKINATYILQPTVYYVYICLCSKCYVITSYLEILSPGVKDCLKCPAGFYCPEGTRDPVPCPPGTFNPLEGQDELADCRECYAGKACTQVALRAPDVDCMQGWVTSLDPLQKQASAIV